VTPLFARLRRFVVALACLVPALAGAQDNDRPFSKERIDPRYRETPWLNHTALTVQRASLT
jgi:hypothetical protein